ncbi:unnamed protein product [Gadus morhua 'NCC']
MRHEGPPPEPPLQCPDQGLKVSLLHRGPYCRPLQRQCKVVHAPDTPAVIRVWPQRRSRRELGQLGRLATRGRSTAHSCLFGVLYVFGVLHAFGVLHVFKVLYIQNLPVTDIIYG